MRSSKKELKRAMEKVDEWRKTVSEKTEIEMNYDRLGNRLCIAIVGFAAVYMIWQLFVR